MEQADYPPLYVTADSASLWGQRWHRRIISANLVLIIAGAGFSYIADAGDGGLRVVAASIAAIFLIAGMLPRKLHARVRDDKHWFEGRAIAETVKSLTWRYMMRVPPFAGDAAADSTLVSLLNEVKDDVTGVESIRNTGIDEGQITPRMREVRSLSLADRRDIYDQHRLSNQIAWYSQRAAFNRSRATRWSRVNISFELAAVIAALSVIVSPNPWLNAVGIFASISVAATAWTQLGQHQLLTRTYGLAASELERIQILARAVATEDDLHNAVTYGEGAISREHTLWTAKRSDTLAPVV